MSYIPATISEPNDRPIWVTLFAIPYASPYFSAPNTSEVIRGGITVPIPLPSPNTIAIIYSILTFSPISIKIKESPNIAQPKPVLTTIPNLSFSQPSSSFPPIPIIEYIEMMVACNAAPCSSSIAGGKCPREPVLIKPFASIPTSSSQKNRCFLESFTERVTEGITFCTFFAAACCSSAPYGLSPISSGRFFKINREVGRATTRIISAMIT